MDKKKRWTLGILLVILGLLGAGAGIFGRRSREEEKLSLIYIPKIIDETNDFWTALLEGARTAAEEYGVHLEVKAPDSEEDYEGQNALIQEILEREEKPDALIISPVSYTQSTHFLERIKEQGIALVLIDSEVDKDIGDLMVSTDNLEAGKKLGEYVKKILPEGKKVAVVGHVEGASTAMEREKGFREGMGERQEDYVEVVYCGSQYQRAYELSEKLMEKYPDLGVIAGLNEYSAVGAARAVRDLKAADQISMVGIDSSQEGITMMEQGVFQGFVLQKPFKMGYLGVKYTIEMLRGEKVPSRINAGSELVTPVNMYTEEHEKLLFPFKERQN